MTLASDVNINFLEIYRVHISLETVMKTISDRTDNLCPRASPQSLANAICLSTLLKLLPMQSSYQVQVI